MKQSSVLPTVMYLSSLLYINAWNSHLVKWALTQTLQVWGDIRPNPGHPGCESPGIKQNPATSHLFCFLKKQSLHFMRWKWRSAVTIISQSGSGCSVVESVVCIRMFLNRGSRCQMMTAAVYQWEFCVCVLLCRHDSPQLCSFRSLVYGNRPPG